MYPGKVYALPLRIPQDNGCGVEAALDSVDLQLGKSAHSYLDEEECY